MTDLELAKFLGIADKKQWPDIIAKLDPAKRSEYERAYERSTKKTMNKATFNVSCAVLGLISLGFIGEIMSQPQPPDNAQPSSPSSFSREELACMSRHAYDGDAYLCSDKTWVAHADAECAKAKSGKVSRPYACETADLAHKSAAAAEQNRKDDAESAERGMAEVRKLRGWQQP